ncbi:MAG: hypothetical protein FWD69_10500 [Polyangiaceae bacterium]|nr:hypothetical protein [Polyangiaceae bacterium]
MADLPRATTSIDEVAGAFAGNTGAIVVFGVAAKNADMVPRVFSSATSLLDTHGYSQAADYIGFHLDDTGTPAIFVPLPSAVPGTISAVDVTKVKGTSEITVEGTVMEETDATIAVVAGGTIGTPGIMLGVSLDGGRTTKLARLGTDNKWEEPHLGITVNFAPGTLNQGDTATFTTTAPMWDQASLQAGRLALAGQQKLARTWLVVGDLPNSDFAGYVATEANSYETAHDRYIVARASVLDRDASKQTWAQYVSACDLAFASIDGQRRIDLSLGRARGVSTITGWKFRRPASWVASLREYQHDVQIPSWRKTDGPSKRWDMTDGQGHVVEYDDRTIGGALAARFTCLRTWANGPNGTFVALSLTRAVEGSLLSRTHNMQVANVACTTVQAAAEDAIGQTPILNDDGTATSESLQKIEERVNTQLQIALLQNRTEGPRASNAVWSASKTDILNVVPAWLTGVLDLNLNGTLERIDTRVRIMSAGA